MAAPTRFELVLGKSGGLPRQCAHCLAMTPVSKTSLSNAKGTPGRWKDGCEKGATVAVAPKILLTDTQLGDQSTVTVDILVCQIVQHLAALTNHHQQTTAGVVVVLVYAQMVSQLVDAGSQDRNLNFGRAGVALVSSILQDNLGLLFLLNHGIIHLYKNFPVS